MVFKELRVMKAMLWLGFMGVAANGAFAQGARQAMQGNPPGDNLIQNSITQGNRPAVTMPPGFPGRPHPARAFAPVFPLGFGGYGFGGYGFGGSDYGYVPQAAPSVVVLEPPPPYVPVPERPPETATLVIHEYPPLPAASTASAGDQPVFAIVLKDSTILSASAVVVQNDALHLVDPDGVHQRVSLEAVDREATKRVNRERKLQLQLPPGR
jgi:hypothetical protein